MSAEVAHLIHIAVAKTSLKSGYIHKYNFSTMRLLIVNCFRNGYTTERLGILNKSLRIELVLPWTQNGVVTCTRRMLRIIGPVVIGRSEPAWILCVSTVQRLNGVRIIITVMIIAGRSGDFLRLGLCSFQGSQFLTPPVSIMLTDRFKLS
jgi:hypothetical protein